MMKKDFSNYLKQIYLLFFLYFSPWYDLVYNLPRLTINNPILSHLTAHGLANLTLTLTCMGILLSLLIPQYRNQAPVWQEWLVMMWPLLNVINFKKLDVPGVVTLYNSFFLAVCLLCLIRHKNVFGSLSLLRKWGFRGLLLSYSAAIFLPLLIPIAGRPVFIQYGDIVRFAGWSGIGCVAFSGITLFSWGLMNLTQFSLSLREQFLHIGAMLLGVIGINLTALRIGWIALTGMASLGILWHLGYRRNREAALLLVVLIPTIFSFSISKLSEKAALKKFNFQTAKAQMREAAEVVGLTIEDVPVKPVSLEPIASPLGGYPPSSQPARPPNPPVAQHFRLPEANPLRLPPPQANPAIEVKKPVVFNAPRQVVVPGIIPSGPGIELDYNQFPLSNRQKKFVEGVRIFFGPFDSLTNGRIGLIVTLIPSVFYHPIVGLGTGGAGRYLREIHYSTLEAHNEYLRLLVDHAAVGFVILLGISAVLINFFWRTIYIVIFLGIAILMLTDNFLIYPSFGYGPLFLATGIFGADTAPWIRPPRQS